MENENMNSSEADTKLCALRTGESRRALWTGILITLIVGLSACGNREAERQAASKAASKTASQAADRQAIGAKIEMFALKFTPPIVTADVPTKEAFQKGVFNFRMEISHIADRLPVGDRTRGIAEAFDEVSKRFDIDYFVNYKLIDMQKTLKEPSKLKEHIAEEERLLTGYRLKLREFVEALRVDSK